MSKESIPYTPELENITEKAKAIAKKIARYGILIGSIGLVLAAL